MRHAKLEHVAGNSLVPVAWVDANVLQPDHAGVVWRLLDCQVTDDTVFFSVTDEMRLSMHFLEVEVHNPLLEPAVGTAGIVEESDIHIVARHEDVFELVAHISHFPFECRSQPSAVV